MSLITSKTYNYKKYKSITASRVKKRLNVIIVNQSGMTEQGWK